MNTHKLPSCPKLSPIPISIVKGQFDLDTRTWVDLTQADTQVDVMRFEHDHTMRFIRLIIEGDKMIPADWVEGAIWIRDLVQCNVGDYLVPYGMVCPGRGKFAEATSTIIYDYLGDYWATVQALQLTGRFHDRRKRWEFYAYLYTIQWGHLGCSDWEISARKVHIY